MIFPTGLLLFTTIAIPSLQITFAFNTAASSAFKAREDIPMSTFPFIASEIPEPEPVILVKLILIPLFSFAYCFASC